MPQPLHRPDDPMAAHLTALYDRVARLERRPIASPFSPQFAEYRISGESFTLGWPGGLMAFRGNLSPGGSQPQIELLGNMTTTASVSGDRAMVVHDQYGTVTTEIAFSVYALTQTTGMTLLAAPILACSMHVSGWDSTGAGGGTVPFSTVDAVDGTYFTSRDNGDGTFSPVMRLSGLYLFQLWATL